MKDCRFVFAGNRFFVLSEMLRLGLHIDKVYAVPGSFLERELKARSMDHTLLPGRDAFVDELRGADFDVFVSNGCPVILPISALRQGMSKRFVNIHPSCLPDLRGVDPVPGALLFGRDSGATCHLMDDGIDTGPIISRLRIPNTDCLDCGLLYQLSFMAEQQVFREALDRDFAPLSDQPKPSERDLYYTRKAQDLLLDLSQDAEAICYRIRAFGTRSQGAYFLHRGEKVVVRDVEIVTNPFLLERLQDFRENEVAFVYEGKLLLRKGQVFLKLKDVTFGTSEVTVGDILA